MSGQSTHRSSSARERLDNFLFFLGTSTIPMWPLLGVSGLICSQQIQSAIALHDLAVIETLSLTTLNTHGGFGWRSFLFGYYRLRTQERNQRWILPIFSGERSDSTASARLR